MSEISDYPVTITDFPNHSNGKIKPPGKVSFEEFLEWTDEDTHAEWVDGET